MKYKRIGTRREACHYAHEDTAETREYWLDSGSMKGTSTMTLCGHWFSICEDDPKNYRAERWRFNMPDDWPTCPICIALNPYGYHGMRIWVNSKEVYHIVTIDAGAETWTTDGGGILDPKECRVVQRAPAKR